MANTVYLGKYMYAIFSNKNGLYVQPCKVTKVTKDGFYAECHNGGESGHEKGEEFFSFADIGNGIYYSKDSAEVNIQKFKHSGKTKMMDVVVMEEIYEL